MNSPARDAHQPCSYFAVRSGAAAAAIFTVASKSPVRVRVTCGIVTGPPPQNALVRLARGADRQCLALELELAPVRGRDRLAPQLRDLLLLGRRRHRGGKSDGGDKDQEWGETHHAQYTLSIGPTPPGRMALGRLDTSYTIACGSMPRLW